MWWAGDNERLCAMELQLWLKKIPVSSGSRSQECKISTGGQSLTYWATETPELTEVVEMILASTYYKSRAAWRNRQGTWLVSQGSWVWYPVWQHTFVSPSAFSRRAVVSYWRKYVHKVLVNRLGGLSLPRKSVVKLTDRPDMTLDVYRGR